MPAKNLKKLLNNLQAELSETEELDSFETRKKLEVIKEEIDSVLKYSDKKYDFLSDMKESLDSFGNNYHSTITAVDKILETLSKMGI